MLKIIRLNEVKALTGLPRSTLYKKISQKTFPVQVPLGHRAVGWLESDVQNWIHQQITKSHF
jgi:prophage regulatory protein